MDGQHHYCFQSFNVRNRLLLVQKLEKRRKAERLEGGAIWRRGRLPLGH